MSTIKKAVIPVAGIGTRFLPATKAQPKEMLAVVDKPAIQYIVEEAAAAGIEDIVIITSANKRAIEDHFDRNFELEYHLEQKGKADLLKQVRDITRLANFIYIRQKSPRGWGDAILTAQSAIGNHSFAYFQGDDIIDSDGPAIEQLAKVYDKYGASVFGAIKVPTEQIPRYGIIDPEKIDDTVYRLKGVVEKPSIEEAPSDLASCGRFIFTPDIFEALKNTPIDKKSGELQGQHGIQTLLQTKPVYAVEIQGTYYDCGNKLEYLKAQIAYGLKHSEIKDELAEYLKERARG